MRSAEVKFKGGCELKGNAGSVALGLRFAMEGAAEVVEGSEYIILLMFDSFHRYLSGLQNFHMVSG